MAISYSKIRKLLDAKLAAIDGIPTIIYENTKTKPGIDPWCRSTLLPTGSSVASVGSGVTMKLQGRYQIDLFYPQASGTELVGTTADSVLAAFFPGVVDLVDGDLIVTVNNVSQFAAVNDKTFYKVSVMVDWYSFAKA